MRVVYGTFCEHFRVSDSSQEDRYYMRGGYRSNPQNTKENRQLLLRELMGLGDGEQRYLPTALGFFRVDDEWVSLMRHREISIMIQ